MQSDNKYIDNPDDFSQKVGDKLREHQMPVDFDVWDLLTEKFPPQKRHIPLYLPWTAAGVAAVALILLFLIDGGSPELENVREWVRYSDTNKTIKPQGNKKAEKIPELAKNSALGEVAESGEVLELAEVSEPSSSLELAGVSKPSEVLDLSEAAELTGISEPEQTSLLTVLVEPEKMIEPEQIVNTEKTSYLEENKELMAEVTPEDSLEAKVLPVGEFLAENHLSVPDQERRGYRSLMASLGSGGVLLDFSLGDYDMNNPQYYDSFPDGDLGLENGSGSGGGYYLLRPSDYTDVVHRLPVSFSLTANFPVGRNVALETGLSYTYLFSRFRRDGNTIYRGTLQQHYIGIPVNLRYIIWQNDAWNMYLLGGGSIEKGLRSIYKQEIEYNGGDIIHTNVYSRIDGFQFSTQGGAGFSYRLRDNLDLFGEPRIVYYFKNNQPMSARTENPLIFGLNMGIRLQFK